MANNEFNIDDYLPKATTQDNSQPAQTTAFNIDDYLGIQANDVTGLGEKQAVDFATQLANFPNASPVQQYIAFEQYGNQYKDYLTGKGYSGDQIAQMMAEFSKADPRNQTSEYEYYIGDRGKEVMVGSGNLTGDALAVVPESIPVIGSLADQAEKYVKDTTKAWKNAKSARSQIQTYLGNKAEIEARANGASEFSALMANLKENPMQIVSLITEQAPQLLLGGMGKATLTGVNVAGGAGRVRSDIEEAYETTAKENPSQLLQLPEIKDRMANGMSFEEAVNDAKTDITDNWKSIAAGAVIGGTEAFTPLGKLGQGVNRGVLKTLGKEVGQEAFQEGAEQLNSNLAVGSIDGKTQAFDNVIRNSTLGGITGLGTGIPTAIEAGLNKNKPIQTQAQTLLNSDEQTIQQENIQPEQPNTETNQPQQAVENPQQNANPLDEFALSQALASIDEESHAEFQQRLERDLANGKAESRKSGKYGKFVQNYLNAKYGKTEPDVVKPETQHINPRFVNESINPEMERVVELNERMKKWIKGGKVGKIDDLITSSVTFENEEAKRDFALDMAYQEITAIAQNHHIDPNDGLAMHKWVSDYLANRKQGDDDAKSKRSKQYGKYTPFLTGKANSVEDEVHTQPSVEVGNEADVTNLEPNIETENNPKQLEHQYIDEGRLEQYRQAVNNLLSERRNNQISDQNVISRYTDIAQRFPEHNELASELYRREQEDNEQQILFSQSPMKNIESNIKRGRERMTQAILDKADVKRGMWNSQFGWVDFVWGDDGTTKPLKSNGEPAGRGIAHIFEARQRKDGQDYQQTSKMLVNDIVNTVAKGQIVSQTPSRLVLEYKENPTDLGHKAVLTKDKSHNSNSWLLTGFENDPNKGRKANSADERTVGYGTSTPTQTDPMRSRESLGAAEMPRQTGDDSNIAQSAQNVNQNPQVAQDQATLSRILGEKTASHIQVVDSNTQIPTDQNVKKLAANGVEGWFDVSSQKLYIISDNITANEVLNRDERLAWVAFHELSHAGVRIKYGPILTNVLASAGKNVVVKVLARKIQAEYGYTQEVATEEAMAEIYTAFETGNWAELESRYKVKIHQSYKQGKDSVGDFLTKVANILRRLIGGIVGKDLTQTMTTSQVFDTLRGIQQGVNDIANTEQNQTASGDARYSLNERSDSAFAKAVDEVVNGNVSRGYIAMGTTPDVLKMLGLPDTKIRIQGKTIEKVMGEYLGIEQGKHSHLHNLTPETLKRLPQNINNPVAVFNSSTKENGYVVLTELTETDSRTGTNKPVIAALHLKPAKGGVEIIDIASVYGRSQGQLQTAFDEELLYLNKEKAQRLNTERLQLSWDFTSDVELSARNVKTEADLSQYQAENSVRYSFAGRNAKTANHSLLEQAERDLASGKDPETIRQETGWFKGVDGKWRFEIDDSQISFKQNFDETDNALSVLQKSGNSNQPVATVGDILNAPELFAAYPDIAKINVVNSNDDYTAGGYSSDDFISLDSNLPVNKIKSTLLHELQHAIQNREQFAYGGSIDPRFIYVLQQEL